ncbi:hypothetical protein CC1G_08113 [Coprinopsis cinerea okayama7|uniref:Uncharacterized protein n=1 Tax=Coprinopsis cinerea (strain Okayama-7 / 130 / ATCC MYA-4618 / FGSC 9003) TaxID=240176 RepID=A8NVJ5_COPC7|nr:hypothetical protein CC1G_08113 [Coprinopsis cinerea okayama7\|eukprot:XP_001836728.2 hypothetical protein CC1G_08113 [Coprinopsis cinerea okayama7\
MSTETDRFVELATASRRLIREIYASRDRSPRESLLILLEQSKIVKDLRKSLGLDAKTLDLPIKLLFSEISKNHRTYLDKDVKTKPHITLNTEFLSRLPPVPPDFQQPGTAAGATKGMTLAKATLDATGTGSTGQGGEGKGKGRHLNDGKGVGDGSGGEGGEGEGEGDRGRHGGGGDMSMDEGEDVWFRDGDEGDGGREGDGDELGGEGCEAEGDEGEHEDEGEDGGRGEESGQGGGPSRKRDNTHMSPQAKRTKKKKVNFGESATRPSPPPEKVRDNPTGGATRRTTRSQSAKGGSKGGVKGGMKGGVKGAKGGGGKTAEGSKGPAVEPEGEGEIDKTQCSPPEPGKGFDVADPQCGLCILAEQRFCWRPPVGSCHRCRLKKQKCTFSKTTNPKAPPPRATSSAAASSSGSVLLPSGQSQWALYSLPSGLPAGTVVDSSTFARHQDIALISSATQDLQADVYSMRGQLHNQADDVAEKMGNITVRLGDVEEEYEKMHADVVKVTVEMEDIRAQFDELCGQVPNNAVDLVKVVDDITAMGKRIGEQEKRFGVFKQRFGERLTSAVKSAVVDEVDKKAAALGDSQDGKWIPRFESVDNTLGQIDNRLRKLEDSAKVEELLGQVISREVDSRFEESERKLEGSFKKALQLETQRLAESQVNPADLAKEVSQSLERHWPTLLTPILSTTLTTHLRERIGEVDANIARVGEELGGRLRSMVQEEISRYSQDIIQEAVTTTMRNLTVEVPTSNDGRHHYPPYPTFIDPDLFEQAYEPLVLPPPLPANGSTSISTFHLQDPSGIFQAGLQESVLTAVPEGVSSVRARPRTPSVHSEEEGVGQGSG